MSCLQATSIARHPPAVVIPSHTSVRDAILLMNNKGVRHAIVSEDGRTLTGIISAKDLLNFLGGGETFSSLRSKYMDDLSAILGSPIEPIVNRNPILAKISEPLPELMGIMAKHDIGMLPLLNEDNTIWGALSERHLFCLFKAQQTFVRVSEIMSEPLVSIDVRATLLDAMRIMIRNDIRRLPVTDGIELWGIVTVKDIIRFLSSPSVDDMLKKGLSEYILRVNVAKISTRSPRTVEPDVDLCDAVRIMNASNIGSLIVISNGNPVGIITERDFLLKLPKLRGVEFMTDVSKNQVLVGRIHF
ncbi:MAG: CBS domain-containing protein [Candidatus Verstraetearchaeota archaeon]|nr:CBS domain-containing protein [Candidatus Verstraetearchaeota archaeon]